MIVFIKNGELSCFIVVRCSYLLNNFFEIKETAFEASFIDVAFRFGM